jgi:ribosomal protein L5
VVRPCCFSDGYEAMQPSNFYITEQLALWRQMTHLRYGQLSNTNGPNSNCLALAPNAHLNHPLSWSGFSKVVLNAAGSKLVNHNQLYAPLALAFACVGGQTPRTIKSKQHIYAFGLVKHSFMGGSCALRRKHLLQFQYKLCWLAPDACPHWGANGNQRSMGLQYFAFPEPDQLDYQAFEILQGFEFHLA